jgi:hypothetical protein
LKKIKVSHPEREAVICKSPKDCQYYLIHNLKKIQQGFGGAISQEKLSKKQVSHPERAAVISLTTLHIMDFDQNYRIYAGNSKF